MAENEVDILLNVTGNWQSDLTKVNRNVAAMKAQVEALGGSLKQVTATQDGSLKSAVGKIGAVTLAWEETGEAAEKAGGKASRFSEFLGAELLAEGFRRAFDLAFELSRKLGEKLKEAGRIEVLTIAASGDLSTNLGVSQSQARKLIEQSQIDIAKAAAALPGTTADYSTILHAIAGAVADGDKGNASQYQKDVLEVTKRAGMLAALRGVDPLNSGVGLSRAIAGTTGAGELFRLELFEKNPQFVKSVRQQLQAAGVSTAQWQQLDTASRLSIIKNALKVAAPDAVAKDFEGTFESLMQTIQTQLFDPMLGVFGLLRHVAQSGGRTTLDAIKAALSAFMGLGNEIASKLPNFDPMAYVIRLFDFLADVANGAHRLLAETGSVDLSKSLDGLISWLSHLDTFQLGRQLGDFLGSVLGRIGKLLEGMDDTALGSILSNTIAKGIEALGGFLSSPGLWLGLGRLVFDAAYKGVIAFNAAWDGAWNGLVNLAVEGIQNLWEGLKHIWDLVGQALTNVYNQVQGVLSNLPGYQAPNQNNSPADSLLGTIANTVGGGPLGFFTGIAGKELSGLQGLLTPSTQSQASKTSVFSPNVNVQAQTNADPGAIANAVMGHMNTQYKIYQAQQLGTATR